MSDTKKTESETEKLEIDDNAGNQTLDNTTEKSVDRIIIMPVDNSVFTKRAISWYREHLMREGDLVHMVHVVEPIYNTAAIGIGMEAALLPIDDLDAKIKVQLEKGKHLVKKCLHKLTDRGGRAKGYLRIDSKVGEAIIRVCHEHGGEMILMANRGEGIIRRTFMGSVSDYVLHHAERTVIIVPPETRD